MLLLHATRFQLNVTSKSHALNGFAVLELKSASPRPSHGNCTALIAGSVSPVAVALVDQVTVFCSDWKDNSGDTISLLEYHIFVNDSAEDGRFDWYPLYRGSRRDVTFFLSQLRGDDAVVNLYVDVIDSFGSARRALHA